MPQALTPLDAPLMLDNHEDDATAREPGPVSEQRNRNQDRAAERESSLRQTATPSIQIGDIDIDGELAKVDLSTLDGTSVSPAVSPPLAGGGGGKRSKSMMSTIARWS